MPRSQWPSRPRSKSRWSPPLRASEGRTAHRGPVSERRWHARDPRSAIRISPRRHPYRRPSLLDVQLEDVKDLEPVIVLSSPDYQIVGHHLVLPPLEPPTGDHHSLLR